LPQSLDDTYERILRNIDEGSIEDARRILILLCFSSRPLTVQELIDGIAVDLQEPACLNLRRRLQDVDDLREICPGLIDVGVQADNERDSGADSDDDIYELTQTLRIAHFSVQEYLESERIKLHRFALKAASAHEEIAQICLVYLQEPGLSSGRSNHTNLKEFPLAHFAAQFWHDHYKNSMNTAPQLDRLILALFQRQDTFFTWVKLHDLDCPSRKSTFYTFYTIPSPVYYASLLGLDGVLLELVNTCQDHINQKNLINAEGGYYDNALQAASAKGHKKVVQMLIDAGVNVENRFDTVLEAASANGHEEVMQILLNNHGVYENGYKALKAASGGGHEKIVQMLIDAGVSARYEQGLFADALQAASYEGHEKVVQMLINAGAWVDYPVQYFSTVLQTASYQGHEKVVQMLINAGADINDQGGEFDSPLHAALMGGREKVVQMLMDAGASINAQGRYYGNALQAASYGGLEKVVQILINAGINVNAQDGHFGTALQAASEAGHEKVVQMLIDAGADVNVPQGGSYGNALQAASRGGYDKVVQMLIDAGADVNAQSAYYDNALQAASKEGHDKVVQMLMDAGAVER
jgi:ankyrin repeat domain-containing protein 50